MRLETGEALPGVPWDDCPGQVGTFKLGCIGYNGKEEAVALRPLLPSILLLP